MGNVGSSEVIATVSAIERSLKKNGYSVELGTGLKLAQEIIYEQNLFGDVI